MDSIKPSNRKDTLFLFTNEFPYGNGESFIESELSNHLKYFKTVKIFPLVSFGSSRPLDERIIVVDLFDSFDYKSFSFFSRNTVLFLKIMVMEFYFSEFKYVFLKQFRTLRSILSRNFKRAELLKDYLKTEKELDRISYYSFWTDDWATILSVLKEKNEIKGFVSRVHGYDLYAERWPDKCIPFRELQFKNASKVLAVSADGLRYLSENHSEFKNKFYLNHLSIFDNGLGPFERTALFTMVSCSNLIPLKRVHLIAEMLCEIDFPIRWIHFGDGVELQKIKLILEKVKSNVVFDLKGGVANTEIIEFYRRNSVNLFVQLSETEGGVPLALQEAASFGIPLLGTVAGGAAEIINEKTGISLPVHFEKSELKKLVSHFRVSEKNTIEFRTGVRAFWKSSFNSDENYNKLYTYLTT